MPELSLLAISDPVALAAITAVSAIVLAGIQILASWLIRAGAAADAAAARADAQAAALKVGEVKTTLAADKTSTDLKLDKIHDLSNGAMEIALAAVAVSAREIAVITKDAKHVQRADEAEEALAIHRKARVAADEPKGGSQ